MSDKRFNESFIELMEKLSDIMLKNGEPFRARAYQKAQETIMGYPTDIMVAEDLKGKPGIGSTIMDKLNEYVQTGTLEILEREKNNPVNILTEIYGIGPKKAKELVNNGIVSVSQLRENQHMLNDIQKVGLQYYENILERIPRSEIENYKELFQKIFNTIGNKNSNFEIVGSYRRGANTSGDIDVIITSKTPSVFTNFIDLLVHDGIITNILSRGPTKCLVIAKLKDKDVYRRVDFLYTSVEEFPFAILYFTGSKIFNTVMRHQALAMGFTMNEHGLYKMQEDKKKGDKVHHCFNTEKDIFDYLNMEYKQPHERIDGRSVILKSVINTSNNNTNNTNNTNTNNNNTNTNNTNSKTKTVKKKAVLEQKPTKKLIIEHDYKVKEEKKDKNHVTAINFVNNFKKNGISVFNEANESILSLVIRESNKAYYNNIPFMTDNEYDIIKEFMENKYPSNQVISEIGATVERNKVVLPYSMASMDKIKPDTDALNSWTAKYKGPYTISCKLDGVSGLYTTEGSTPKLYTRGDGKVGQDISHFIPYLRLPKKKGIVIRGEFIIPKVIFQSKYKTTFANPRNMVAGIINHKTINNAVNDLHFVAYEVIKPVIKPSEQLKLLQTLDVEVVLNTNINVLTNELLSQTLIDWRQNHDYEIDGVIVSNDSIHERKTGNPEHAFAFKMVLSDQIAEAKVVDVIWTPSKDGYLKPRVQIEPINLGGVRIEYATGFNASFINENKIGVGAIIEIIRSGDVIPHIRKVTVSAENAKMPSVPYKWNNTHIDVLLEDLQSDETVKEKNITCFFKGIGVEGLSSGNISRIIHSGFDTVPKIIKMKKEDFLEVEGFKDKMATKIYNGIRVKVDESSLVTIMSSSNIFGRGFSEKRLELIMECYPNVLLSKESDSQKVEKIMAIKGMAIKTSEAFVERIPDFIQFIKDAGLVKKLLEQKETVEKQSFDTSHPLYNKSIVITGFRDKELEVSLKIVGAKLGSSVSKNTFVVIVKNNSVEDTTKIIDAKKLGIIIMTESEFKTKFL
jgi:NAD-dependent DNA ligase/DNA polymerase/3'-5' exonuclease PolX